MTFTAFRKLVDKHLIKLCGLTLACMSDVCLDDFWPEDSPDYNWDELAYDAALYALEENGFPTENQDD